MSQTTSPSPSLAETLKTARLSLDLALAGMAGGPGAAEAIGLLQRRLMADTNSGCNTGCCGGGGSGCIRAAEATQQT
jgi:hypothetical protein